MSIGLWMRRGPARDTVLACALVFLGGCATRSGAVLPDGPPQCADGFTGFERHTLFFGLSIPSTPDSVVSAEEWNEFSRVVLSSHFGDGMTILDAYGEWRGAGGRHYREPSKVVIVLYALDQRAAAATAISQVIAEARRRFAQEAVLWEVSPVCARF